MAIVNFGLCFFIIKFSQNSFTLLILHKLETLFFSDYDGWKRRAERTQLKGTSYSALGKNSANLIAHAPPVQPVHGRTDWAAKYGSHR